MSSLIGCQLGDQLFTAVEALIIPETSTPAGDKGNPAKTKELDKLGKKFVQESGFSWYGVRGNLVVVVGAFSFVFTWSTIIPTRGNERAFRMS